MSLTNQNRAMKPAEQSLNDSEVLTVNGIILSPAIIQTIDSIRSLGNPIDTIQALTVKMTDALLDRESIHDDIFVSVIISVNSILSELERIDKTIQKINDPRKDVNFN